MGIWTPLNNPLGPPLQIHFLQNTTRLLANSSTFVFSIELNGEYHLLKMNSVIVVSIALIPIFNS